MLLSTDNQGRRWAQGTWDNVHRLIKLSIRNCCSGIIVYLKSVFFRLSVCLLTDRLSNDFYRFS